MLLVMDVGNTNIKIGLFSGNEPSASWRVRSNVTLTADEYGVLMSNLFATSGYSLNVVKGIIISSVIPSLNYTLAHMCEFYFRIKPIIIGAGVKTGLNIKCDNPKEVGSDRIVSCVSACAFYKAPVIVVDFGSATTFSVVNDKMEFVGGAIAPGMKLSIDTLVMNTANLPNIELLKPKTVISKSTIKCMQSGIVYGFVGMVDYLLMRMKKELNLPDIKVVATGGLSELISDEVKEIDFIDRTLTLKGLKVIYELNKS